MRSQRLLANCRNRLPRNFCTYSSHEFCSNVNAASSSEWHDHAPNGCQKGLSKRANRLWHLYPGFEKVGKNGETLVCKLKKSLYGLKQSGRNWNDMLHSYLCGEKFTQSLADPCVYTTNSKTDGLKDKWASHLLLFGIPTSRGYFLVSKLIKPPVLTESLHAYWNLLNQEFSVLSQNLLIDASLVVPGLQIGKLPLFLRSIKKIARLWSLITVLYLCYRLFQK